MQREVNMKTFSFLLVLSLSTHPLFGQTVYTVSPGTKGNTIELTVVNQNGNESR